MKYFHLISVLAVGAAASLANASSTLVDNFTDGIPSFSIPSTPDYDYTVSTLTSNPSSPLDTRGIGGAEDYLSNDYMSVSEPGNGKLTAKNMTPNGGGAELLLFYRSSLGETDLSAYSGFTMDVSKSTGPFSIYAQLYSSQYGDEAGIALSEPAGFNGVATMNFSDFTGSMNLSQFDAIAFQVDFKGCNKVQLDNVSLTNAVPEPSTYATLGLGMLGLVRRRFSKKRA